MHTFSTPQKPASSTPRPSSRQSALSSTQGSAIGELRRKPSAGFLTATRTAAPALGTTTTPAPSQGGRAKLPRITATATATTTRRSTTSPAAAASPLSGRVSSPAFARPALRPRDKNVVALAPRLLNTKTPMSVTRTAPKMPPEKGSATHARQPQMPPLSAAAARGVTNKAPLTPKIATVRSPAPQARTVTVTTPLPKRAQRAESVLSTGGANNNRDDVASPVAAFLHTNVTPRSGSRQSRIDSATSTPTSTPTLERQDSWEMRSGLGLAPSALEIDGPRRPMVTFTPPPDATKQDPDSKFFYASQASKPPQQPASQARPAAPQPPKAPTFFYANGGPVQERQNAPPTNPAPVLSSAPAPEGNRMSKFIYANGTPGLPPAPRPTFSSSGGSTVSTSSKLPTGRLGAVASPASYASQRPPSPIKLPSFPPPRNDTTVTFATPRSTVSTVPPLNPAAATLHRGSIDAPSSPGLGHSRTRSLTVADPPTVARIISSSSGSVPGSSPSSEASSPSNISSPPMNATFATPAASGFSSLLQAADDLADDHDDHDDSKSEVLLSPTKSSAQEQALNDLVASARRERKVQDLEITNASLEAINRTIERQLRKQTAELRRYRRLSRSGRLSLNSVPTRDRIASDSTAGGGALARAGLGLDDLSEEESEEEREDAGFDEESMTESDTDSEAASDGRSPGAVALRDARHRKRDEERLQLDLSKHQELLVDSQKMNQSLKRCLGWTEELIKEGRRALAYQVRVSEVNIGGRVLAPEDVEECGVEAESDGEETMHGPKPGTNGSLNIPSEELWPKEPQDRDSGIELPPDGG